MYSGTRRRDKEPVAVKVIKRGFVSGWDTTDGVRVPLEISMLTLLSKVPGVIRLLDWYEQHDSFYIVMERPLDSEDLFSFIQKGKIRNDAVAKSFFGQVLKIVADCYMKGVVHRDIKDENILVTRGGTLKLLDFGSCAYEKSTEFTDFDGTVLYYPPEWFLHNRYRGESAAVWSLGVLLYIMVHAKIPFENIEEICAAKLYLRGDLSEGCRDLIIKCLSLEPDNRPSLQDLMNHSWFEQKPKSNAIIKITRST